MFFVAFVASKYKDWIEKLYVNIVNQIFCDSIHCVKKYWYISINDNKAIYFQQIVHNTRI